jgi:hypothetical protein
MAKLDEEMITSQKVIMNFGTDAKSCPWHNFTVNLKLNEENLKLEGSTILFIRCHPGRVEGTRERERSVGL